MGCAKCDYTKKVCLVPGIDAFEMTDTSAGKVCMGRTPFRWEIQLPFGNDPFTEPQPNDLSVIFMQTYQAARMNHLFFSTILAAGIPIPRATWDELDIFLGGMFYESDNWMASSPTNQTPQTLQRGVPLGAFECETYVRCYGNPLPRNCFPTFKSNESLAALTFGYAGTNLGPLTVRGMLMLDYGMVPLEEGVCYMENPVPGVDPATIAAVQGAMTASMGNGANGYPDRPSGGTN